MNIKLIRNEADYQSALHEVETLWEAPEGSDESDRLEILTLLIQNHETEHHPVRDPDPITLLEHVMDTRDLSRKDLEPYIGSRARVSEVLNRQRALTLDMIRRLSKGLGLPADVLVKPYRLKHKAA
ncbi:MAG: helix-turn-helix domain-containing protein [Gammaproteobacteria bacterium]|nr:helix-turn-helix domain-containing protein [Gammaproteobacteria bacterium]MBU6509023.1 helix-turn-helix domain-containing protein [Gammaproteobacteria bacterium]MDE1984043.1 helix-turn-helix domain-containing protein [Gammaproteobacteria bacterium]MDE2108903.1 helix-turn-helix domain-containing protein [Gammaproteobacteria bacterium]MDE2461597.1 helix-turn-helix domain-containing protein [Gammaproteobacteria bacterium]